MFIVNNNTHLYKENLQHFSSKMNISNTQTTAFLAIF